MIAKDVMAREVVSVEPDTTVQEIARLLLTRHISAVPVIDADRALVGIVSEGDLMDRQEAGTQREVGSWWLNAFVSTDTLATRFSKSHGRTAAEVMTPHPVTVTEDTPLNEIARLLETRRIKRVPVIRANEVVGIVSRANLLHGLATVEPAQPTAKIENEKTLREQVAEEMAKHKWSDTYSLNVTVDDGVVHVWGVVGSTEVRDAISVLIREIPDVKEVENHLGVSEKWMFWA